MMALNMSIVLSKPKWHLKWQFDRLIDAAIDAGIVIFVAAGNNGPQKNTITYPGSHPRVITINAIDDNNTPQFNDNTEWNSSSRGRKKVFSAPGVEIRAASGMEDGKPVYTIMSGTSMATPFMTGLGELILQEYARLSRANKIPRDTIAAEFIQFMFEKYSYDHPHIPNQWEGPGVPQAHLILANMEAELLRFTALLN